MREILSFIFDRLTDPLGLPISALWEYVILLAIGSVAYVIAYSLVGDMYATGSISSGAAGSIFHWIIRFFVFVVIWAITYAVIWLVKFITAYWVAILCTMGGILLAVAITCLVVKLYRKKQKNSVPEKN